MAEGVPHIWTLKDKARGLPVPSSEDMDSVAKLMRVLPEGDNKQPWYTFYDEAMLVMAGLVYDKVFGSEDRGTPPTWDELVNIVASKEPQLVDFDDILMDHPSLSTRVPIVTKTKPRESMIPEATSTSPPPTSVVHTPAINPLLKRMATAFPSALKELCPKKRKSWLAIKRRPRELRPKKRKSWLAIPLQAALEEKVRSSKGKSPRQDAGEASAQVPQLPKYNGPYLVKPYEVSNLEVTKESPWGAHKFHFHLAKPLLSKEMAAQYTPLVDPYAAFAQAMKHINRYASELLSVSSSYISDFYILISCFASCQWSFRVSQASRPSSA
ncbi:hypothetical protein LIER_38806 [Lithospermum erythrorhizon]|uniref:Uncharacterized protein n=1 Tax=Lithospermum erythrorhizon TaxID=34254 RepID=A0AAV3Q6G7_LITER